MNAHSNAVRAYEAETFRVQPHNDLQIKVIVINRSDATERLAFQKWQLDSLGLDFIRLDAYTPENMPKIHAGYWKRWSRPLRPNEKAKLLSHGLAWDWVIDNGPALIVEDDAVLSHILPEILQNLEMITEIDFLSLEVRGRRKLLARQSIPVGHGVASHRLYLDKIGSAAYVLWPNGAKKLAKRAAKGAVSLDGIAQWATKVDCYQIDPACAVQLDIADKYGLNAPLDSPSKQPGEKFRNVFTVRQTVRLILSRLHKLLRFFRYGAIAQRRKVELKPEYFNV